MRKVKFIITSICSVLIEYLEIYLFNRYIFHFNQLLSYGIMIGIFLVMSGLTFVSYYCLRQDTSDDEPKPNESILTNIIEKVNQKYQKHFKLIYLTSIQPNPAWCIENYIYVNNNYSIDEEFLGGVVAHELGHAISGIGKYTFIASMKPSTMFSKILYFIIIQLNKKRTIIKSIISNVLLIFYFILSLNNIIFVYPMIRSDEYFANKIAVELGYGNELRCYYGLGYDNSVTPIIKVMDLMHPTLDKMIERLNDDLGLSIEQRDYYIIGNKLIKCTKMTKTITLPNQVKIITSNAFTNPNLKKITAYEVLTIETLAFANNLLLEELIIPKTINFSTHRLNELKHLTKIDVNDEEILKKLIKYFDCENLKLVKQLGLKIKRDINSHSHFKKISS